MRVTKLSLALLLLIVVASAPTFAEKGDKILRFGPAYVDPTSDFSKVQVDEPPLLGVGVFEADSAVGAFVGLEFMLNDLLGLDATLLYSNHDFTDSYTETIDGAVVYRNFSSGDASMMPLLLSVDFHFLRNETSICMPGRR